MRGIYQGTGNMKNKIKKLLLPVFMIGFLLTGCGKLNEDTKIVLTTGFAKDEVFRIETSSCYKPEVMVYLTNMQNQYEQVYGKEIWEVDTGGASLEESIKQSVLAQLAQIKTMNLMAENYDVQLNDAEKEKVEAAAKQYYESLNDVEKEAMDVSKATIERLYTEYAIANKVYEYIIQDVNPEISDDEARKITVQQIVVRTYRRDSSGKQIPLDETEKRYAYSKLAGAVTRAAAGEDFEALIDEYSDSQEHSLSFGKGEMDPEYEEIAFNLGNEEISRIFELEDGYYLLKCVSTFNKEETDANKIKIVEQRRNDIFSQEYDSFVNTLIRNMNQEVWDEISMLKDEKITTADFFDVYNS